MDEELQMALFYKGTQMIKNPRFSFWLFLCFCSSFLGGCVSTEFKNAFGETFIEKPFTEMMAPGILSTAYYSKHFKWPHNMADLQDAADASQLEFVSGKYKDCSFLQGPNGNLLIKYHSEILYGGTCSAEGAVKVDLDKGSNKHAEAFLPEIYPIFPYLKINGSTTGDVRVEVDLDSGLKKMLMVFLAGRYYSKHSHWPKEINDLQAIAKKGQYQFGPQWYAKCSFFKIPNGGLHMKYRVEDHSGVSDEEFTVKWDKRKKTPKVELK